MGIVGVFVLFFVSWQMLVHPHYYGPEMLFFGWQLSMLERSRVYMCLLKTNSSDHMHPEPIHSLRNKS